MIKTLFAVAAIISLASCTGGIMKDETAFAQKVSSALNGVPVSVSFAAGVSTEKGTYNELEVEIDSFTTIPDMRDQQLTYATSIPAILYFSDSALRKKKHTLLKVIVNERANKAIEVTFTPAEIEQAERCVTPFNGFIQGLRTMDVDSLKRYGTAELWEDKPVDSLLSQLKKLEKEHGKASTFVFGGFRKSEDGKVLIFPTVFERTGYNHRVIIGIDPLIKKVIYFRI
jgi:hypothetical protein